ncbi:Protein OS-9 [Chytriomyces hyalinus]|nr:Protein OS-9 [Chytriomyces hyalinus]
MRTLAAFTAAAALASIHAVLAQENAGDNPNRFEPADLDLNRNNEKSLPIQVGAELAKADPDATTTATTATTAAVDETAANALSPPPKTALNNPPAPAPTSIKPVGPQKPDRSIAYHDMFTRMFPKNSVVFSTDAITQEESEKLRSSEQNTQIMAIEGTQYLCSLPNLQEQRRKMIAEEALSTSYGEISLSNNQKAYELIEGLNQGCMNWTSNYWIYSYCHEDRVIQYSNFPEGYKPVKYLLGIYRDTPADETFYGDRSMAAKGGSELRNIDGEGNRYLRMWYGEGDWCNTGLRRVVQIQFTCCRNEHIARVQETTTCQYVMFIHTPRACHDLFKAKSAAPSIQNNIICTPILKENTMLREREDSSAPSTLSLQSMITNNCKSSAFCAVEDEPESLFVSEKDSHIEPRSSSSPGMDILRGPKSAGILPDQVDIEQDAFDTLWLDEYDPIYLDAEEMQTVIEDANNILLDLYESLINVNKAEERKADDPKGAQLRTGADPETSVENSNEAIDAKGSTMLDANLQPVTGEEEKPQEKLDPLQLIRQELVNIRMDLWRRAVEKKDNSNQCSATDENGLEFSGEGGLYGFDLWETAANEAPEEAVDALERFLK